MENSKLNPNSIMPVTDITLDGVSLDGFEPLRTEYNYELFDKEGLTFPKVEAVATDENVKLEITQATKENPVATIKATSSYGIEKIYYKV